MMKNLCHQTVLRVGILNSFVIGKNIQINMPTPLSNNTVELAYKHLDLIHLRQSDSERPGSIYLFGVLLNVIVDMNND